MSRRTADVEIPVCITAGCHQEATHVLVRSGDYEELNEPRQDPLCDSCVAYYKSGTRSNIVRLIVGEILC